MRPYIQGDVVLKPVNTIPTGGKVIESKILAYGETSGHVHQLVGDCEVTEIDGRMYVDAKGALILQHVHEGTTTKADHEPFTVPEGLYQVVIQREFDPYERAARKVMD